MSSSFPKVLASALFVLGGAPLAQAQQTYFIPNFETAAEWNTNRELVTTSDLEDKSIGYRAQLGAQWGRVTPRSDTELRPRIVFQEFPDRGGVDPVEYFLDLRSHRKGLKSEFNLLGFASRQDTYNAEFGNARFSDLQPVAPDLNAGSETGIIFVGETRTRFQLEPSYFYTLTERTQIGGTLEYENVRYDSDLPDARESYESPRLSLNLIRNLSPQSSVDVGPYYVRFESDSGNVTDSYGVAVASQHLWSELSSIDVTLTVEHSKIDDPDVPQARESSTDWGLVVTGSRRNRVGRLRYSIGRTTQPSSFGSRRTVDEARLQYDRPLSPRLSFNSAVRLWRDRALSETDSTDRNRARLELALRSAVTRSWYVMGGYRYAWQDIDTGLETADADNQTVFLGFGYQGLDRRQ